jgi:hypothetical protein
LKDINALVENDIKLFSKQKNKEQENNIILDYEKKNGQSPFLEKQKSKKIYFGFRFGRNFGSYKSKRGLPI